MKEDNLCRGTLTHVSLEESCSIELTGLNSSVSSLNCEKRKDLRCHCFNDNCKKWTNEEHNRYLDYLEMSFVKQLHNSMGLPAWYRGQSNSVASPKELVDLDRSSEQFTVLQGDQYLNINSEKDQSHSHTGADSVDAFKVPQTQSLKQKNKNTASAEFQECCEFLGAEEHLKGKRIHGPASCSQQKHLSYSCGHDSIDSLNEGTGQNFVDEDLKENTSVTSCIQIRIK